MKNPLRPYIREDYMDERLQKGMPAFKDRSMWLNMIDPVGHRTADYPYQDHRKYVGFRIFRTSLRKEKK
jgi:hypothetical protein